MATRNIQKLKQRILEEKARLEGDRYRLTTDLRNGAQNDGDQEDQDATHPGDAGAQLFEREKEEALTGNITNMLNQINDALAKIEAGTYGTCARCGKPIPDARLDALPYASF